MAENAPILVVESDLAVLQRVEAILHRAGHEVAVATDGALAINKAIASPPPLVITAAEMPLLDGFKLCQLLRTNPVTREAPFVFLTSKETSTASLGKYLRATDEFLLKPFKEEELLGRVEAILQRVRAGRTTDDQQRLLGTLTEITLMDLLQVLRMNRRSGLLDLESDGRRGVLYLSQGEVVDAEVGRFRGEKAFYRTLDWTGGRFEFRPQAVTVEPLIKRPGENLILEGLRQIDEVSKLRETLAPPGTRLVLQRRFEGPPERLRPVTREVLRLLEFFSSLEDVLDQSAFLDLEICQTLEGLVAKKVVGVVAPRSEAEAPAASRPLLSLEDALKLSYELGVGREEGPRAWVGKVFLITESGALLRPFLETLSRIKDFRIDAAVVLAPGGDEVPLGPVGTFQVLEGTEIVLYSLPGGAGYRPLWESLSGGALGAIVVAPALEPFPPFAAAAERLGLPLLVTGPDIAAPGEPPAGAPATPWRAMPCAEGSETAAYEIFRSFFGLVLGR